MPAASQQEGRGVALTTALLNAAGGAMPSYLHGEVAASCRVLFTARPEHAASWVEAAAASPAFRHHRVGAEGVANYCSVPPLPRSIRVTATHRRATPV